MSDEAPPEADRLDGAPHPREAARLVGQAQAEAEFLQALNADRLHHGWMITGPKGIGKATLAWRIARALIADPPGEDAGGLFGAPPPRESLDLSEDHPVARRIKARSEPGLLSLTRPWDDKLKRFKADITVDEVRKLKARFGLSAADGGWRVAIVDAADEMNTAAANAFLKLLEEPPARTTLLLVSHQPSAVLPTIRSRCRTLRCTPLGAQDLADALAMAGSDVSQDHVALTALAGGSAGRAVTLQAEDGLALYRDIVALLGSLPREHRARAAALAQSLSNRGAEGRADMLFDLLDLALARLAKFGATGGAVTDDDLGEAEIFARLAPTPQAARAWATDAALITGRARHGRAVNLDPGALILDTLTRLAETAARVAA